MINHIYIISDKQLAPLPWIHKLPRLPISGKRLMNTWLNRNLIASAASLPLVPFKTPVTPGLLQRGCLMPPTMDICTASALLQSCRIWYLDDVSSDRWGTVFGKTRALEWRTTAGWLKTKFKKKNCPSFLRWCWNLMKFDMFQMAFDMFQLWRNGHQLRWVTIGHRD